MQCRVVFKETTAASSHADRRGVVSRARVEEQWREAGPAARGCAEEVMPPAWTATMSMS